MCNEQPAAHSPPLLGEEQRWPWVLREPPHGTGVPEVCACSADPLHSPLVLTRVKKEVIQRLHMVAAEFRKVATDQMWDTTKRAILENNTVTLQLSKVSRHSMRLLRENDQLKGARDNMSKQLELLEDIVKAMAMHRRDYRQVCRPGPHRRAWHLPQGGPRGLALEPSREGGGCEGTGPLGGGSGVLAQLWLFLTWFEAP